MFTQSFPPADALLDQITRIEYKKHLHQFLMFTATVLGIIVGVSQFVYNKISQWYSEGGKELLLEYTNRAVQFINNRTGLFDKLYALIVSFYNRIELIAHKISDVTDVEVAQ